MESVKKCMFFYGTLMPALSSRLSDFSRGLNLAFNTHKGYTTGKLHEVAGAHFPGAVFLSAEETSKVWGQVVEVSGETSSIDSLIARLHRYEGCNPSVNEGNLYNYKQIKVTVPSQNKIMDCSSYEIAHGISLGRHIEDGMWNKEVFSESHT